MADSNVQIPKQETWAAHYPKGIPANVDQDIDSYQSILSVFDEACKKFPSLPAYTNMGKSLTFTELSEMANAFAAYLQNELKLQKGDRIAIQMPNLLQYPIAIYGALRAGLVIVNTNPLYTAAEMKHQFNDSGATTILIVANFAFNLEKIINETGIKNVIMTEIGDMMPFPKRLIVNAVVKHVKKMVPPFKLAKTIPFNETLSKGASMKLKPVTIAPTDLAFLQYTGGTTGVSKGAMLTHRNLIANMEQIHHWVSPRLEEGKEVGICALPLYHIFALTLHGLALMKYGCNNVLITNPRDIPGFVNEMKKSGFTLMSGVNTLFNGLMNHPKFGEVDFKNVKLSVAGGMALQGAVAKRWKESTKSVLFEGYGLTEASPVVCCNPVDGTDRVGTIGLPIPSTFVRFLDEDGKDVAIGEPGELACRGPQVMKGYWQRQDETDKVMTKDGWLKTGDIATIDHDGFVRIVDRKKDMILVSGFNVFPNEVEDAIASHPGVLEVAAIGVANDRSGEVVKVFIVKKDPSLTEASVIEHARQTLTSYKVPKIVEFRTELPKTNVGKILRRALKEG